MEVDVNPSSGRLGVVGREIQERIKCGSRVRIQQRIPQPRLADHADGQILPLTPRITKTRFPVPTLYIIAKFSHLTLQADIKQRVPVGELLMPGASVINAAEPN